LTQGTFANRLNVTRETVSRWERGRLNPRHALQMAMAKMTSTHSNNAGKQHIRPRDIDRLRKKLGLTQAQFAMLLHTTRFTVLRWESGVQSPHSISIGMMNVWNLD
jgi:DNA-binding transcriptional regulator YiaG